MVGSRTATALAGLAISLLASALAWYYFDTLVLFLLVPFVPFLLRRQGGEEASVPPIRTCPTCDFRTRESDFEYCPRDGSRLE